MTPLQWAAFALYLPVLGAIGYQTVLALWVLGHGMKAGAYALPYALAFGVLARRAFGIYRGRIPAGWADVAAAGMASLLLLLLALR